MEAFLFWILWEIIYTCHGGLLLVFFLNNVIKSDSKCQEGFLPVIFMVFNIIIYRHNKCHLGFKQKHCVPGAGGRGALFDTSTLGGGFGRGVIFSSEDTQQHVSK